MHYKTLADGYDLFLFDMDGTLILGQEALPGAADFLAALRRDDKRIYFVTNNTLHPNVEHAQRLRHAGIAADDNEILNPLPGLLAYVQEQGFTSPFVIASEEVKNALPTANDTDNDVVILGLCRNWDYAQLQKAVNLALAGKPFVLCQPDPYCPDPNGNIPDSGALRALIETTICRSINAEIIGKPSPAIIAPVLNNPQRTIVFGDRLKTDMKLADNAGIQGALVLTGQTTRSDVTSDMPYIVLNGLQDIQY